MDSIQGGFHLVRGGVRCTSNDATIVDEGTANMGSRRNSGIDFGREVGVNECGLHASVVS